MHGKRSSAGHPPRTPETKGSLIRWARFYDLLTRVCTFGHEDAYRASTLRLAGIAPGERVLDVGCGTGTLALMAKRATGEEADVTGIDGSPEMIDVAREKAAKQAADVRFQVALIEELPFPDGHFDLVLSSFMLHHLPDELKRTGCSEIRRVLKPDGRLLAVDLSGKGGSVVGVLSRLIGHRLPADYAVHLARLMEEAGLRPEVLPSPHAECVFIRATRKG